MKRLARLGSAVLFGLCLWLGGCEEQARQRSISISDTTKQYLNAIQLQDGLRMAELSVDQVGFDFTISASEAAAIGMGQVQTQRFYKQILQFEYSLGTEIINEDHAQIQAFVRAYPITTVLEECAVAKADEFAAIQKENMSDTEKNAKIADVFIAAFAEYEKTYQFEITFHLQRVDEVWLIENADAQEFIEQLFEQPIPENA
ncbi:MAG: hypothetical protein HFE68_02855 [Erysipelotrichaceae bacterium]|nr:hypothetical protein [Erysipelotrichaceae bacterium]